MANDAGRELGYLHWPHEELAKAMVQAEDDIKYLQGQLREMEEERDQYLQESRDSARVLGGIIKLLRDVEEVEEVQPREFHQRSPFRLGPLGALCVCGKQWLPQANRCVAEPAGTVRIVS